MNLGKALLSSIGPQITLPAVGAPFQGGYYVGRMTPGDGFTYALIVAPRATGQAGTTLQLKTSNTATTGTISTWDGAANTASMITAGAADHPAANFCKGLTIGGYTDWALPAKDQLELIYRQLKPGTAANNTSSGANPSSDPLGSNYTSGSPGQTTVTIFKTGGSEAFITNTYWTSTETSATSNFIQLFTSGSQSSASKTGSTVVRAVRMIKI